MVTQQLLRRRTGEGRRAAFTLLEVLVVVAILVVLASVASIYVFRYLEESKVDAAKADCRTLSQVVETYILKNGEPQALTDVRPYVKETSKDAFLDPWGKQYQLRYQDVNGKTIPVVFTTTPEGMEVSNLSR